MVRFITKVEETLAHRKSHGPHWSALEEEEEEEVYTRPLPLTSLSGGPPVLRSCAMADLVCQFGRTILEGMVRVGREPNLQQSCIPCLGNGLGLAHQPALCRLVSSGIDKAAKAHDDIWPLRMACMASWTVVVASSSKSVPAVDLRHNRSKAARLADVNILR